MGNKARFRKTVKQPVALADTHMQVNGCQVLLGHPDANKARQTAAVFKKMLGETVARAKMVNIGDMYNAHFEMCERLKDGESVEEIMT